VRQSSDIRVRALAAVFLFGFVFFSASVNKLPGYLLPLMPALVILVAIGVAQQNRTSWLLAAPVALTGLLPGLPAIVAAALAHGLRSAVVDWSLLWLVVPFALIGIAISLYPRRDLAFTLAAVLVALGFVRFEQKAFPAIDQAASARPQWRAYHPHCASGESRDIAYGLYYYSGSKVPECNILDQNGTLGVR
jgi:4-amino-4-deoxy-L-arabinose transferase-like glycosyltransferase